MIEPTPTTANLRLGVWQDTRTAPRDGTPILGAYDLHNGSYDAIVVWWRGGSDFPWQTEMNAIVEDRIAYWMPIPTMPFQEG
jgi:hypothetical protein